MIEPQLRGPFFGKNLNAVRSMIAERGARAVIDETLAAIERANPSLNAFVHIDADGARAAADALDARGSSGRLHGVPVAVKDLIDVAGLPITYGSRRDETRIASTDAAVVQRLRDAGAIVVGITLTHEFAYGPTGDVSRSGPAHNPHDLARMTGGSSAGTGAAVAAGLVPLGLGTDTGGSIRIPAALCGCVGIKPAFGAVPVDGVLTLARTLDHVGPLAASVDLAAAAYEVLAGATLDAGREPQWAWLDIDRVPHVDGRVAALVRSVFDRVSEGATAEVALGNWPQMRGLAGTVMAREAFDAHADVLDERRADYDPQTWERFDSGRTIGDDAYRAARTEADQWRDSLHGFLGDETVLVCPSVGITAPPIGERSTMVNDADSSTRLTVTNLTVRWNLMGFPTISVPCGELDGLPVGLQLIGRPGSEATLVAAALRVEQAQNPS